MGNVREVQFLWTGNIQTFCNSILWIHLIIHYTNVQMCLFHGYNFCGLSINRKNRKNRKNWTFQKFPTIVVTFLPSKCSASGPNLIFLCLGQCSSSVIISQFEKYPLHNSSHTIMNFLPLSLSLFLSFF